MEHFVTLFNSLFLPQGIALHLSMERCIGNYVLWILCVDDQTYEVLSQLNLPRVRLLKLSVLETDELLRVRSERTIGEYCWTLTPFAPRFVFEADPEVQRVTYLDADIWFRKHPGPIFRELEESGKHVLITDHAYAPEYDISESAGQFCVQFMIFARNSSESIRKWWEEQCVEWCYARFDDGKFGDQKYLDLWPIKFDNDVHVLKDNELTLAPWNASRFPYGRAVFFHFHGFRVVSHLLVNIGGYKLPNVLVDRIYRPYCDDICRAIDKLSGVGFQLLPQARRLGFFRSSYRRLVKIYKLLRDALRSEEIPLKIYD